MAAFRARRVYYWGKKKLHIGGMVGYKRHSFAGLIASGDWCDVGGSRWIKIYTPDNIVPIATGVCDFKMRPAEIRAFFGDR